MPVKNKARPTQSGLEGEIVGLNDNEKKVLEDAGISGGTEIPTITLMPTSADPISGTLTDDQIQILQNNEIIKFIVPSYLESCAFKLEEEAQPGILTFSLLANNGDFFALTISTEQKIFTCIVSTFPSSMKFEEGVGETYNCIAFVDNTGNAYSKIYANTLRKAINYQSEMYPLGKYKIYEDTADTNTLVIEENW